MEKGTRCRNQVTFTVASKDGILSTGRELALESRTPHPNPRPLPGAQEQHRAEFTRSRGSDVNLRQQSLSRNFPGALSSFPDEEEKGQVGLKRCWSVLLPSWGFYCVTRLGQGRRDGLRVHHFRALGGPQN